MRRGFARSKGEYIFFHSADDFTTPTMVEKTVGMLEKFKEAGFCTSYFSVFNSKDNSYDLGVRKISSSPICMSQMEFAEKCHHG